ncbi:hypothetical protein [Butyrivibrio sp. INlla21]|uniref:hypothetical protein n=1 Tax=Butyrivibrio sp. INlla21 TaxID=1520811 RepID=UPI0008EAA4E6|nr:hypothetical protein [Butyrivibrio sp. INlla21]SFU97199.1 hypothetical protein SAMN02910342_02672 [Butyrivibrio sp. INlla21]
MKNNCFGTIYLFEIKKILKSKAAIITFLILLVLAFVFGEGEISGNESPEARSKFAQIDGRVIDDNLLDEYRENTDDAGYTDDSNPTFKMFGSWFRSLSDHGKKIEDVTIEDLIKNRDAGIQEAKELSYLTTGECEYWEDKGKEIVFPGTWHDTLAARGYLGGAVDMNILLILFLIPMGLSIVFASEYQNKTDQVVRASKYGDKRTYYAKILAGMTFGVGGSLIILGSFIGYMALRWGTGGLDLPIILLNPYTSYNMTAGGFLLRLAAIIIIGCILTSAVTLFLSQAMKNSLAVMGTSVGLYLGISMISAVLDTNIRPVSQFIQMLPAVLIDTNMVYEYRLINIFGKYFTVFEYAPIMYIIFTIVFIALGRFIYGRKER